MRCPHHARDLKDQTCPVCQGELLPGGELEARVPGSAALLSPAHGPKLKARVCPSCARTMEPLRIGKAEAFVYQCAPCDLLWLEKADAKTLELLTKSAARQAAYAAMSAAEKKELATGLAEATHVDSGPDVGVAQVALSAATGMPLLDRVQGDRTPLLTWVYAALVAGAFVALDAKSLAYAAGSEDLLAAFTSGFAHFDLLQLVSNAAFLLAFGTAAEKKVPRWVFAASVLGLAPLTTLLQSLDAAPGTLLGGANGVIAGLLGISLFVQPRARVTIYYRRRPLSLPLWLYGGLWALLQAAFVAGGTSGTGFIATFSGFAAGLAIGFPFRAVVKRPPPG